MFMKEDVQVAFVDWRLTLPSKNDMVVFELGGIEIARCSD